MFLLILAHPGCPGQNPKSRKMVVCMCVCVIEKFSHSNDDDEIPTALPQKCYQMQMKQLICAIFKTKILL